MEGLTIITPTCDQPTGIALCEKYMRRQTLWGQVPIQWIVVDDGIVPADLTQGQTYLRRYRGVSTPAQSFCLNLLRAIPDVRHEYIFFVEHDDWYAPTHLEETLRQLKTHGIAGDPKQRYYNVASRQWRLFDNIGSSLCQTGIRRAVLDEFKSVVEWCLQTNKYGVDRAIWERAPDAIRSLERTNTVVGIKGLPGRPGLGVGHRPSGGWTDDPDLSTLREWIGEDAVSYDLSKCA